MKPLDNRCTISFKRGQVNHVVSQQFVLVDGIPRRVSDLHPALERGHSATAKSNESSIDELSIDSGSGTPENITAC